MNDNAPPISADAELLALCAEALRLEARELILNEVLRVIARTPAKTTGGVRAKAGRARTACHPRAEGGIPNQSALFLQLGRLPLRRGKRMPHPRGDV
jgi:hypothetical protein